MIGIIGGGISGLTLAYELQKKQIPYILLEASERVGGVIRSERKNDTLLEFGPNSLLCDQETKNFIQELGLNEEIISSNPISKNRFIVKNKALTQVPQNPISLLFSSFFSFATKIKILKELKGKFNKSTDLENETLHDFFERHFGNEIVEYLVNPFISGIYAGSPKNLITSIAFPSLINFEKKYGSILKGFTKNKSLERKEMLSFKEGLETLPKQLGKKLQNVHLNSPVHSIEKNNNQYLISYGNDEKIGVEKIVFTCSPKITARLLAPLDVSMSELLKAVDMPPMHIVHTIFDKKDITFSMNGFGVLHPKIENMFSAGAIWNSSIFNNRTTNDKFLITSFVGGSQYLEQTQLSKKEILENVKNELQKIYNISPTFIEQHHTYYPHSIPQYNQTVQLIWQKRNELAKENLFLAGNLIDGISMPDCIKNAKKLAKFFKND